MARPVTWPSVEGGDGTEIQVSTHLNHLGDECRTVTAARINTRFGWDPNPCRDPNQLGATYYRIVQVP